MAFVHGPNHGQLTINSIPMMCPAWRVLNLQTLDSAANVRGTDVLIPGLAGVKARRRRTTVTERSLEMIIRGDRNWAGDTYSNVFQGKKSNVRYLRYYVARPPTTTAGTHSAVLTDADGSTVTRPVHVVGFEVGDIIGAGTVRAVLDLSIPDGEF